jgi:hypothetical protein
LVERSLEQKVSDRLLLLWLIKKGSSLDAYELQIVPFRAEYELQKEGMRAFNYEFFQYNQGPLSIEVYDDRDFLKEQSLISVEGFTARITPEGKKLVSEFEEVFKKNRTVVQKLEKSVEQFSKMSSAELVADTHKMIIKWEGKPTRIGDLPKHATILSQPRKSSLELDSATSETLAILFQRELIDNLRKARKEGCTSSPYRPLVTA